MIKIIKTLIYKVIILSLSACGGGGGSNTTQPEPQLPTNSPPTVSVENINVDENTQVTITATANDADGDELAYHWEQTSGEQVVFTQSDSSLSLTTPDVEKDTEYTFEVSVSDGTVSTKTSFTISVNNVLTREESTKQLREEIYQIAWGIKLPEMQAIYGSSAHLECETQECLDNALANDPDKNLNTFAEMALESHDIKIGDKNAIIYRMLGWHDHDEKTTNHIKNYIAIFNEDNTYTLKEMSVVGVGEASQIIDFNGDNLDDIYYADHGYDFPPFPGGQDKLFIQQNDGSFIEETDVALKKTLDFSHGTCSADFDSNGYNDVVVVIGGTHKLKMNSAGVFTEQNESLPQALISYDWLVKHGYIDPAFWEPGPEESWDDRIWASQTMNAWWWCEIIDANNDGFQDIAYIGTSMSWRPVTNYKGEDINESVLIMLNDGTGNFHEKDAYYSKFDTRINGTDIEESGGTRIEALDLNNDGYEDFVILSGAPHHNHYVVSFMINDTQGNFDLVDTYEYDFWPLYFQKIKNGFVMEDKSLKGPITFTYKNGHMSIHSTTAEELEELSLNTVYLINDAAGYY